MTDNIVLTNNSNWSNQIIEIYSQGASDSEVAASLRVTLRAFYKQIESSSVFKELVEFGRTLSQAWWESQYRKNVNNKNYNSALLNFYMKNKHGWADKVDTTGVTENTNVNLDELRLNAAKEVEKFIKRNTPELTDAQRVLSNLGVDIEQ